MSEFTLVIGNKNYSTWSLRPWIFMKHLGIEFDEVHIELYSDKMKQEISPYFSNGKVPVLKHNDLEIWDSLAIIEYIAALYPEKTPNPDLKRQAVMRSLCAEMHSSFVALRKELQLDCSRTPESLAFSENCSTDIDRIQALWQYASEFSDGEDNWLFGSFSMADAMFAPVVLRFSIYKVPLQKAASTYVDRMLRHPAMVEWMKAARAEPAISQ